MIRIIAFVRPFKLEGVKSALSALGVTGLTVSDVRGSGTNPEKSDWLGAGEGVIALPVRSRIEIVAESEMESAIIDTIVEHARTGEEGDGKIFVEPMLDVVRIRTEERGTVAI